MANTFTTTTATPATTAEGYYVKRAKVIRTAGQDNYDLGFNLDNDATVADEAVAQAVFDTGDRYVDSRAYVLGLTADPDATGGHYLHTDHAAFAFLSDWASRWARAQGYLLRGTTGDATNAAEGQMGAMKAEAEQRIDELLLKVLGEDDEDGTVPGEFGAVGIDFGPTCATDEYGNG